MILSGLNWKHANLKVFHYLYLNYIWINSLILRLPGVPITGLPIDGLIGAANLIEFFLQGGLSKKV